MNNDLISRSALKETFENSPYYMYGEESIIKIIDNAPTVSDHSVELVQKSIELGRRVGKAEEKIESQRPQGEWKLDDTEQFCYCSNCEDTYYPRPLDPSWYYCPHCGADMKGGAE